MRALWGILLYTALSAPLQAGGADAQIIRDATQRVVRKNIQFKAQTQFAHWSGFLRFVFGVSVFGQEKRYVKQKKHVAQLEAAAEQIAKDPAKTEEEVEAVREEVRKARKVLKFFRNKVYNSHRSASGSGAMQDIFSPRNDYLNAAATTAAHGMEMGSIKEIHIGKRTGVRFAIFLLEWVLGMLRNAPGFYTTRKRMVLTTAAQRLLRLVNTALTHGFKGLKKKQIATYVLQALAVAASFVGSREAKSLAHFVPGGGPLPQIDLGNGTFATVPGQQNELLLAHQPGDYSLADAAQIYEQANNPRLSLYDREAARVAAVSVLGQHDFPWTRIVRTFVNVHGRGFELVNGQWVAQVPGPAPAPVIPTTSVDRDNLFKMARDKGQARCPICLDHFKEDHFKEDEFKDLALTDCSSMKHAFHKECLRKSLKNDTKCPLCRIEIKEVMESGKPVVPSS